MSIKVNVKWGKKNLQDVEINLEEPPITFKAQLYTLTGVPPERQKIMGVKGGTLKDDANWREVGLKPGQTLILMGTAESEVLQAPKEKVVFLEDLSHQEALSLAQSQYPSGLKNLGNTCYANSTLQCLKAVPELHAALKSYSGRQEVDPSHNVTVAARDLFDALHDSKEPVIPYKFIQELRNAFPQFTQKDKNGNFMQQDAEECWGSIMNVFTRKLNGLKSGSNPGESIVQELFTGKIACSLKCIEDSEEPATQRTEAFDKLSCHISSTTNFLMEGLKESFQEKAVKRSERLGRDAEYQKSSKITQLPYYLNVQFVRFFWKQDKKVKAKILRPVEFPLVLDLYDLCSDELKQAIQPTRKRLQEIEDKKLELLLKRQKEMKKDKQEAKTYQRKKVNIGEINLDPASLVNTSGMYELYAVLSHRGRIADSGHYVAWIKEDEDTWLNFDDDVVSVCDNEEIKKLSGKGDWHMAYMCFYRTKRVENPTETKEEMEI